MLSGPPINTSVILDASRDVRWRTRVEELDDEVVVAAPVADGGADAPALGAGLSLRWQGDGGPMSMDVVLVAKELRRLPTWRLRPRGPVVITQRRHHARAGTLLPVALHAGSGVVHAHVVDLSEGGLRLVHEGSACVGPGDAVRVHLDVDDAGLDLLAEVVRTDSDGSRTTVGVRFRAITEAEAETVRRYVFGRQIRLQRWR